MGVPGIRRLFVDNNRGLRAEERNNLAVVYIDANGLAHEIKARIYGARLTVNDTPSNRRKFAQEYVNKLIDICKQFQPSQELYVAFDGYPGAAKMKQQAERRVLGHQNGKLAPHSAMLTTGSEFLYDIEAQINDELTKPDALNCLPPRVVVNGSDLPGEGEHKILNHIRELITENPEAPDMHLIYGADSDFMFLNAVTGLDNILGYIPPQKLPNGHEVPEAYTLSQELRRKCATLMNVHRQGADLDPYHASMEVLVCLMVIGNDFLPTLAGIHTSEALCKRLCQLAAETDLHLTYLDEAIGDYQLDLVAFVTYLEAIRNDYENLRQIVLDNRMRGRGQRADVRYVVEPELEDSYMVESFESAWRQYFANVDERLTISILKREAGDQGYLDQRLRQASFNYVRSVNWVLAYYQRNGQDCDDRWFYPHPFAPSAGAIVQYLKVALEHGYQVPSALQSSESRFTGLHQLMTVLPRNAGSLVSGEAKAWLEEPRWFGDAHPIDIQVKKNTDDRGTSHLDTPVMTMTNPYRIERWLAYLNRVPEVINSHLYDLGHPIIHNGTGQYEACTDYNPAEASTPTRTVRVEDLVSPEELARAHAERQSQLDRRKPGKYHRGKLATHALRPVPGLNQRGRGQSRGQSRGRPGAGTTSTRGRPAAGTSNTGVSRTRGRRGAAARGLYSGLAL